MSDDIKSRWYHDAVVSDEETFVERLRALATNDLSDWTAGDLQSDLADAADRIEALEAELAAERARADALEPYLRHKSTCGYINRGADYCDCGMERALAAHRAARTPQEGQRT